MERRPKLQDYLVEKSGTANVYFQPPENLQLNYPAVIYFRSKADTQYANNAPYPVTLGYDLIVIDEDPDSEIVKRLLQLPCCRWTRRYAADNLNHDVFTLYY